jgi:hypothetical protein
VDTSIPAPHVADSAKTHERTRAPEPRSTPVLARFASPTAHLQRSAGNAITARLLRSHAIQPKLTVSSPDDHYEREADRVADEVMRMPDPTPVEIQRTFSGLQRKCAKCEEEGSAHIRRKCAACEKEAHPQGEESLVQRKRASVETPDPTEQLASYVDGSRSSGDALPESARAYFEPRFGLDLGSVRVHADAQSAGAARDIDALAFATGSHIYFGAGQFQPGSPSGDRLLAHELTHVVQQGGATEVPPSAASEPRGQASTVDEVEQVEPVLGLESAAPGGGAADTLIARAASVTCPSGRHRAPANADSLIEAAELLAGMKISTASMDLTLLKLDAMLPGLGAGGGYTMPTGQRMTSYQASFGLPPQVRGGNFRDRLGGGTYSSQAEALVNEIDALQDRYSRLSDRLLGSAIRYRCIGGRTTVGNCEGHCTGRTATACLGENRIMLCPDFWTMGMGDRAMLLIHEASHLVFSIRHGRNFTHADCYTTYAASAGIHPWTGGPTCVP